MGETTLVGTSAVTIPDAASPVGDIKTVDSGGVVSGNMVAVVAMSGLLVGIVLFLWSRARSSGGGVGGAKVVRMGKSATRRERGLTFSRVATQDHDDYSTGTGAHGDEDGEEDDDQRDHAKADTNSDSTDPAEHRKPAALVWNVKKPAGCVATASAPIPTGVVHVDEEAHMALGKIGGGAIPTAVVHVDEEAHMALGKLGGGPRRDHHTQSEEKASKLVAADAYSDEEGLPSITPQHMASRAERSRPTKPSAQDLD